MATKRDIAAARRRFAKETKRQTRRAAAIFKDDKRFVIRALQQFDLRIRSVATDSLITPETISTLRASAAREVAALEAELTVGLEQRLVTAAVHGTQNVTGPMAAVVPSLVPSVQGVSSFVAGVASEFSASLIGNLAPGVLAQVNTQLTLAAIGGRSTAQTITAIQRIARVTEGRAATIFRTEIGRMMSMATQASLESAAQQIPDLRKSWLWSGIEREDHAQAEADFGPGKGIPVGDDFIVAGEALSFPRDAAGSPGNTINCQCSEQPDLTDGALGEALDMAA